MRAGILASILLLYLLKCEARSSRFDQYETRVIATKRNGDNSDNGFQVIQYKIRRPKDADLKAGSPVFYVVGGRVEVDDILQQYTLFDRQFSDFDTTKTVTPSVVYVEQRYFGKSNNIGKANTYTDFVDLKLKNVIADHITLIQQLATELKTTTFLVAGGGHGGLIAGYLANKFATDATLKSKYNVLGWSSSPPLKYLRLANDNPNEDLQEIGAKFVALLKAESNCKDADVANFRQLFMSIKALRSTDGDLIKNLKLDPKPRVNAVGGDVHDDLKELSIWIRNQMIGLSFDNNPYDLSNGNVNNNRKFAQLCAAIKSADGTLTWQKLNAILSVFDQRPLITDWRIKNSDGIYSKAAAPYYQDCTEYQIYYCPKDSIDATDPFTYSQWDPNLPCNNLEQFKRVIAAECKGLFGDTFNPETYLLDAANYPRSLKTHVVTTMNKWSIFGETFSDFRDDNDPKNYAVSWLQSGVDNWEFQEPRVCDSDRVKDIRYLVLRALGCLGGYIQNDNNICNTATLFNDDADNKDGKPYDDTLKPGTCQIDPNAKFPFTHRNVNIVPTGGPTSSSTSVPGSSTNRQTGPGSNTKTPPSTTPGNGAGALFSATCLLVLAAGALL